MSTAQKRNPQSSPPIPAFAEPSRERLLARLLGNVFHLTTATAYRAILRDGKIRHNRERRHPLNRGSETSFGRLHGYVCLYDLRDPSPARLALTRRLCDFLDPDWIVGGPSADPVYLVLRPEAWSRLLPNALAFHACRATGRSLKYLPGAECWYSGDLPLAQIEEALRCTKP